MVTALNAFSGFSVNDIEAARAFYGETLGLDVRSNPMGALDLHVGGGSPVFIYPKEDHVPATFTILNLIVADIGAAVDELVAAGVVFERYDSMPGVQDERGIMRGKAANQGPDIAWFTDPAGNVLSLIED